MLNLFQHLTSGLPKCHKSKTLKQVQGDLGQFRFWAYRFAKAACAAASRAIGTRYGEALT